MENNHADQNAKLTDTKLDSHCVSKAIQPQVARKHSHVARTHREAEAVRASLPKIATHKSLEITAGWEQFSI